MKRIFTIGFLLMATSAAARSHVVTESAEYRLGDLVMKGYIARNDALPGRRPAVMVVHEWWGLNDYAKSRARALASMGYIAFAVDMYGNGVTAATSQEAGRLAGAIRGDRAVMRARITAALAFLRGRPDVDTNRIAAIGYCFGGTCALELARSGAAIAGVVSFHGSLDTPMPATAGAIRTPVLVLHGADDPYVPAEQTAAFQNEMRSAGADWQFIAYSNAVHAFTNPAAGNDKGTGAAYNEAADRRSWQAMRSFLDEAFGAK